MATLRIPGRAFERSLGRPAAEPRDGPKPPELVARRLVYARLFQVSVENDYCNESAGRCPSLGVRPTPASAALMAKLGLLFKVEAAGFSVLYDQKQERALASYLLRRQEDDPRSWTRLTFTLAADDPYFVSFTDMPIDTRPWQENLYFSNRDVSGTDLEAVFLPTGPIGRGDLRRVVPVQLVVPVSEKVWQVQVLDIAGQEVICKPRCVTAEAAETKAPEMFTCCDAPRKEHVGEGFRCTRFIFVDFSRLPEDLYTIEEVDRSGVVLRSEEVIYTVAYPAPLCLVDLLFSAPPTAPAGIYPVRRLEPGEKAEFEFVHYVLRFERRSIEWRYYIVPPAPSRVEDLRIESRPRVGFRGPREVVLANGQRAYRFVSEQVLPLAELSPFHFRLWGRHDLSPHERVLVDRLPVASGQQVVPARRDQPEGEPAHSDIFVYI